MLNMTGFYSALRLKPSALGSHNL